MKKLLLIPALLFSMATFAQTDKGWRSVGGSGHLTFDFKNHSHSFLLAPEIYWFVADNFALGTDFGFGLSASKTGSDSTEVRYSGTNGYVTLGGRYFFSDTEHKLRPYLFLNGGYEFSATHINPKFGTSSSSSGSGFKGYAGLGLAWFFNEHAAFDIRFHAIDYGLNNSLNPPKSDVMFNPTFMIGIQAFFHHD